MFTMRQQQQKQQHNRVPLLWCITTIVLMMTMMPTGVMSMSILGPAIIPTTAAPVPLIPSNSVVTLVTETTAAETIAEAAASTAVSYSDYGVLMYLASKNSNNEVENVVDKLQKKDDDTNNSTITAPKILEMNGKTTDGTGVAGTTTTTTTTREGIKTVSSPSSSSPSIAVTTVGTNKRTFFNSLETTVHLNDATLERTQLLTKMIDEKLIMDVKTITKNPTPTLNSVDHNTEQEDGTEATVVVPTISYDQPGWINTFLSVPPVLSSSVPSSSTAVVPQMQQQHQQQPIAVGTWKVVYAPHITTVANLFKGQVDVQYQMSVDNDDQKRTIVSHAYYDFPLVGKGYLSVSGTYGSVLSTSTSSSSSSSSSKNNKKNEYYSKVNFDQAWMKPVRNDALLGKQQPQDGSSTTHPYETYEDVPSSWSKTLINEVGKRFFVDDVAIFPVQFLDADTIVFDFELLGTKICAHKV